MFKEENYIRLNSLEEQKYIRCIDCDYWTVNEHEKSNGCKISNCGNVHGYPNTNWNDGCVHGRVIIKRKEKKRKI